MRKKKVIRYRDERGRFIAKPAPKPLRDKHGRFKKKPKYNLLGQPVNAILVSRICLLSIGLSGSLYFGLAVAGASNLEASSLSPPTIVYTEGQRPKSLRPSLPTHLSVPAVGIETDLITLGRTPDGALEVPKSYDVAGWYQYSPTPGEIGPAVIVGHVDSYVGPAVFYKLRQLKPGAIISVHRANSSVANFQVSGIEQFNQNNFPTEKVYGNIEHAGIRLITCGGKFNYLTRQYSDNTVIYGSLIEN